MTVHIIGVEIYVIGEKGLMKPDTEPKITHLVKLNAEGLYTATTVLFGWILFI